MTDPTGLVYRLSPSGKLDTLLSNGVSPNGLVLSPDEKVRTWPLAPAQAAARVHARVRLTTGAVRRADEGELGLAPAPAQRRDDLESAKVL
jgi:sugar lactone lactonase YvrE